jgi:hypothetical protein
MIYLKINFRHQVPETAAKSPAAANSVGRRQSIFPVNDPLTQPEFLDVAMNRGNLEERFQKITQV